MFMLELDVWVVAGRLSEQQPTLPSYRLYFRSLEVTEMYQNWVTVDNSSLDNEKCKQYTKIQKFSIQK